MPLKVIHITLDCVDLIAMSDFWAAAFDIPVSFRTDELAGIEFARLVGLGATHIADHDQWGAQWSVLQDVEGNEFCVVQSEPAPLSS